MMSFFIILQATIDTIRPLYSYIVYNHISERRAMKSLAIVATAFVGLLPIILSFN